MLLKILLTFNSKIGGDIMKKMTFIFPEELLNAIKMYSKIYHITQNELIIKTIEIGLLNIMKEGIESAKNIA